MQVLVNRSTTTYLYIYIYMCIYIYVCISLQLGDLDCLGLPQPTGVTCALLGNFAEPS